MRRWYRSLGYDNKTLFWACMIGGVSIVANGVALIGMVIIELR